VKLRLGVIAVLAVLAWLLPYQLTAYSMHVVDVTLLYALLAVGLGLAMGIAGQINLAQIAFFGVAAYATAILTTQAGYGFWVAALIAIIIAAAVGLIIGTTALRIQSHYLGIVTLGLALAFTNWLTNSKMSGGGDGIPGIPGPTIPGIDLSSEYLYYYLELIVFAISLAFGLFIVHTSLGRRMRAMRDDSVAAGSIGVEVPLLRMTAFLLSGIYGGLAGVLYSGLIHYVSPDSFSIATMFLILAMVIIGGRQSLIGCAVGAFALAYIRGLLVDYPTYAQVAYGSIVVLIVVAFPTGLAGLPARLRQLMRRRGWFVPPGSAPAALRPFRPYEATPTSARGVTLLEVDEVVMAFRGLKALQGVSMAVAEGEIRGVVGPNGSGKTTLFNVVSGLYRPTSGQVSFAGHDVTSARPYRLAHTGIARTYQNLRLFKALTVRENVLVALDRSRVRAAWRYALWPPGVWRHDRQLRGEADEVLDRFGLADFADSLPGALPYGTQRRVEIARAMASQPRLLMLDEPAAGLNGDEVRQLSDIVRSIRASGTTVVIIEHNMALVMSLCDRITVLASGAVIAEGTPAEVARTPQVIEAYLGDSSMAHDVPEPATTKVTR
jgi:branched-chain amino acid transport system ATP-binding protein/branched-chain amino acid transport system permease protein